MKWWEVALVALLPLSYLGVTLRVLVWIFTKAQFTLAEMLCANLLGIAWSTGVYFIPEAFSDFPASFDSPMEGPILLSMFIGYTFALFASATGWRVIRDRAISAQRARFRVLAKYWAVWLSAFWLPILYIWVCMNLDP